MLCYEGKEKRAAERRRRQQKKPLRERAEKDKIEKASSYSVEEADSGTSADFARVGAIGPDREQEFADERDDIGRRIIGFQEEERMTDDVDGGGEIKLVHMGSCTIENGGVRCYQFAKIVQDQACEDFLSDELRSFRVKMLQANGMLEITESGFNAPALVIHFLEFGGREGISVQVGNEVFPDTGSDFNRNDSEVKGIIELVFEVTEVKA